MMIDKAPRWWVAPLYVWAFVQIRSPLWGLVLAWWGNHWRLPRPTWHQGAWVIVVDRLVGGEWISGQTFGCVVLIRDGKDSLRLRIHEFRHVWHNLIFGPFFYPLYVGAYLIGRARGLNHKAAYKAILFERDACGHVSRWTVGQRKDTWGAS